MEIDGFLTCFFRLFSPHPNHHLGSSLDEENNGE